MVTFAIKFEFESGWGKVAKDSGKESGNTFDPGKIHDSRGICKNPENHVGGAAGNI